MDYSEVAATAAAFILSLRTRLLCRFSCLTKWSDLTNRLAQMEQANFFSPVCIRRWRESSSERANFLSQPSNGHEYGRSPEKIKKVKTLWFYYSTTFSPSFCVKHYYHTLLDRSTWKLENQPCTTDSIWSILVRLSKIFFCYWKLMKIAFKI